MRLNEHYDSLLERESRDIPCDRLSGKRVAVTGATGMIGSALVDLLLACSARADAAIEIHALCRDVRRARDMFAGSGQSLCISEYSPLRPIPADARYDYIIHAASPAHPVAFSETPVDVMMANLMGTSHFLEHIRHQGHGRLLYVSSGEVYGQSHADTVAFDEQYLGQVDSMNPRSCYPQSKRASETLCVSHSRQFGTDSVVVRPCHIYGPTFAAANTRADAQFFQKALAGEDIIMKSAGSQVRSYCFVLDAAKAMLWAMVHGESDQAYNISNPASVVSIYEFATEIASQAGVSVRLGEAGQSERAGYSKVLRAVLDSEKLRRLGWLPKWDLRSGVADTLMCLGEHTN